MWSLDIEIGDPGIPIIEHKEITKIEKRRGTWL